MAQGRVKEKTLVSPLAGSLSIARLGPLASVRLGSDTPCNANLSALLSLTPYSSKGETVNLKMCGAPVSIREPTADAVLLLHPQLRGQHQERLVLNQEEHMCDDNVGVPERGAWVSDQGVRAKREASGATASVSGVLRACGWH